MIEAAAQRGFWCARVDANRIEKRKKKAEKKDCTVIESRDFFM